VFEKLRADWRRGRALRFFDLGKNVTFEFDTPSAGPIVFFGRFDPDGETLVFTVHEIYAKDVLVKGPYRAEAGLREMRRLAEWLAGMASDLGYTRLRFSGQRSKGRRGVQDFEFPLDTYFRGQRPRR
jgi:hypothetical protein